MMKREDFMFSVGFDGQTALVDGDSRRRYGRLSVDELVDKGLFRPAVCAAVYDKDDEALERIRAVFVRVSGSDVGAADDLLRIFGIPTQVLSPLQDGDGKKAEYKTEVV
jgi:hypothetical protein